MAAQATMQMLGNVQEFNPDNETIVVYLERMQMFLEVNNVEDAKRVPVLLTLLERRITRPYLGETGCSSSNLIGMSSKMSMSKTLCKD